MDVDITQQCRDWQSVAGLEALIAASARAAAEAVIGPSSDGGRLEVSVMLTSDHEIAALNASYRKRSGPTNVLSFPQAMPGGARDAREGQPAPTRILGDIVLAYETIEREARDAGKEKRDHIAHLVVHGMLHLLGYDHEEEAEAGIMEGLETRILTGLGIADPYGGDAGGGRSGQAGAITGTSVAAAGTEK